MIIIRVPSRHTFPSVSIIPANIFKRVILSFTIYSFGICLLLIKLYFSSNFFNGEQFFFLKLLVDTILYEYFPLCLIVA